jgi:hypothetical protein
MQSGINGHAMVFIGALVFLSVPIILIFAFAVANRTHRQKLAEWRQLPTLDEYLAQHPACRTDQGPACNQCHATSLLNRGLSSPDSKQRILTCDNCDTPLFRSGS